MKKNKNSKAFESAQPFYFNPEEMGRDMKEVVVDFMEVDSRQVRSRWFKGNQDDDLHIWTDDRDHILKQQVSFCGQVVEWNILDGVRTGVVVEEELNSKSRKASEVIQYDPQPQSKSIQQAVALLNNVTALSSSEKSRLIRNLENVDPSLADAVSDMAHLYRLYSGKRRPSLWGRIKAWFSRAK